MDKTVSNKKVDKTGTPISGTLSLKLPMKILFKKKIEFQIMSSDYILILLVFVIYKFFHLK